MDVVARILGTSALTAGLGAGLSYLLFAPSPDWKGGALLLGCVGAMIGVVAGAAREIVTAQRRKPEW